MNSNRYFKLGALLVAGLVVLATVGTVSAVTVTSENVPDEAEVGAEATVEVQLDQLYDDFDEWSLEGETQLENVTWTVEFYDGDQQLEQYHHDGQEISQSGIDRDDTNEPRQVRVIVTGEVPEIETYNYEEPQTFAAMNLTQVRGEDGAQNEIDSWEVHHYTENSKEARETIDDANAAVEDARAEGGDVKRAETDLTNAIGFFDGTSSEDDFENAISAAESAQTEADDAQSSAERFGLLMYGGIGLVGLLVIGGIGYVVYQRQQDDYDKLG